MAGYLASDKVQGKDETDFVGPLHLFVAGGLLYMLWLAYQAQRDNAAKPLPEGS